MARFRVNANLGNLDIQQAAALLSAAMAWDGVSQVPSRRKATSMQSGKCRTREAGHRPGTSRHPGIGAHHASYNGRSGDLDLGSSYISLPSTRIDLSGSLGRRIQVRVVSHNLNDLMPAPQTLPVTFQKGGSAILTAAVTGKLNGAAHRRAIWR